MTISPPNPLTPSPIFASLNHSQTATVDFLVASLPIEDPWQRSTLSDTIHREIYHRKSGTFAGTARPHSNEQQSLYSSTHWHIFLSLKQLKKIEKNDRKNKELP